MRPPFGNYELRITNCQEPYFMICDSELWEHCYFRGLTTVHEGEGLLELGELEAVGDNGGGVDHAGGDEGLGLVPRLPYKAAGYAVDGGPFEDEVVGPVDLDGARGDAEERG